MKERNKKSIFILLTLNLSVVLISLIYDRLFDLGKVGKCQFFSAFGLYCPGCGGSRALNALFELKLMKSFVFYPPIIITSLLILYVDARIFISLITKKRYDFNSKLLLIIPISILLSFAVRYILLASGIDPLGNIL